MAEPNAGPGPGPEAGGPNSHPIKPRFEYRAPSFLWVHRYLLIFFVLVVVAATVWLFRVPHRQYKGLTIPPPPATEPIYVQPIQEPPPIPERPASSAH